MNLDEKGVISSTNTGEGRLLVHVSTARGAIPLEGALVHIRNAAAEGTDGRGDVIATLTSNRDGNTASLPLPAPPRQNSMQPNNGIPYAPYHIDVYLEGYFTQNYIHVPIFDGITAIQPVDMIPLSENGRTDSRTPDSERFLESTGPQL